MYAKCGSIEDAWRVFNKMPSQNVVTWSTMILGHVKCGQGQKALGLFQQMQQEGSRPPPDYCIHADLQRLSGLMHDLGYVPCTRFVLHVVEEEELVFQLCHHTRNWLFHLGSSKLCHLAWSI
ncbi:unnamed protein product [Sphagnum balticum]